MRRIPVTSTMVRSVGYATRRRLLDIEFASGNSYSYFDVPPEVHRSLMQAASNGPYFKEHIRDAFAYQQLT